MRITIEGTEAVDENGEPSISFFYHCDQPLTGREMASALLQAAFAFSNALDAEGDAVDGVDGDGGEVTWDEGDSDRDQ